MKMKATLTNGEDLKGREEMEGEIKMKMKSTMIEGEDLKGKEGMGEEIEMKVKGMVIEEEEDLKGKGGMVGENSEKIKEGDGKKKVKMGMRTGNGMTEEDAERLMMMMKIMKKTKEWKINKENHGEEMKIGNKTVGRGMREGEGKVVMRRMLVMKT